MSWLLDLIYGFYSALTVLVFFVIIAFVLWVVYMYYQDTRQNTYAIRKNYPVIGRFRYLFEHLGKFFRQYFFAQDREEMPFNRAQRSWVYRAAKNTDNTIGFGSTRSLKQPGTVIFLNSPFPRLSKRATTLSPIIFGENLKNSYITSAIFIVSGMSFGAISAVAVRALANGTRLANTFMNTGEGGLSKYHLIGNCDLVFQIGTANYGVRDKDGNLDLEKLKGIAKFKQVKMFELKLSQGSKPGRGGMLPASKINKEISEIRGIPIRQDSISPNRHVNITSNQALLDKITEIRKVVKKPVGFKIALGSVGWLEELFALIVEQGLDAAPDFIAIDGAESGTGSAPETLADYVALPIAKSLPVLVSYLNKFGLKSRIKVIASGKLITAGEVAWALAVGADVVASGRGNLLALGCIQSLQCHKNNCPTGIATQNKKLQQGLDPSLKAIRVSNYIKNIQKGVIQLAHSCGLDSPRDFSTDNINIVNKDGMVVDFAEYYKIS